LKAATGYSGHGASLDIAGRRSQIPWRIPEIPVYDRLQIFLTRPQEGKVFFEVFSNRLPMDHKS
jgi:hypothetical protein